MVTCFGLRQSLSFVMSQSLEHCNLALNSGDCSSVPGARPSGRGGFCSHPRVLAELESWCLKVPSDAADRRAQIASHHGIWVSWQELLLGSEPWFSSSVAEAASLPEAKEVPRLFNAPGKRQLFLLFLQRSLH